VGKRSSFKRVERDYYRTFDPRAAAALAPHLSKGARFIEPCAGRGDLIRILEPWGFRCVGASDIEPDGPGIQRGDVLALRRPAVAFEYFITNPPWDRSLLHRVIAHLCRIKPTWLLFDAGWCFSKQAAPVLPHCRKIVAVGRLRWIEGTSDDGKEDAAWYLFDAAHRSGPHFFGRQP
jgi:hypothetical protein